MSDLFDVSSEVVIVTGASQGLGRRFAQTLAARGAAVVLAARQAGKLESFEKEIKDAGGRAAAVSMDVTSLASIRVALDQAEAAFGPVTVLVNNAGVTKQAPAVDVTEADFDFVVDTNLKGAFFTATEVARRMIARNQPGNIVNIASILSFGVMGQLSPYIASKGAVVQLTKALALEWASKNIRVNGLAPGYIRTDMNDDVWETPGGERLLKRIPQRRPGDPADLDGAMILLASQASRYMTGTVIQVDGGFLLT